MEQVLLRYDDLMQRYKEQQEELINLREAYNEVIGAPQNPIFNQSETDVGIMKSASIFSKQ